MGRIKAISQRIAIALCWAWAPLFSQAAQADGLEIAFFNIDHNSETGALEIVHRFFVQDIEIALVETTGRPIDLDDSEDLNAVVRLYMEARFSVTTLDGKDLKTEWGGVETRATTLLIRQHAVLPPSADGIIVKNAALHETHPRHTNILHATLNGQIYKRDFLANGPPQKLMFE